MPQPSGRYLQPRRSRPHLRNDQNAGLAVAQHFRDFKGTSPIRFLRAARYDRVREALGRAEPTETITEIAAKWGFGHLGRFSVEYRRRFGESPSATLRRARDASPTSLARLPRLDRKRVGVATDQISGRSVGTRLRN